MGDSDSFWEIQIDFRVRIGLGMIIIGSGANQDRLGGSG